MSHVLIIEDEAMVAMHIEALLEEEGASSFAFATTEDEAVIAALTRRPGLITSDVKLHTGDGPLAVQRIVAALGAIPTIFITGTPEDCTRCAPPAIVLTKPLRREALVHAYHHFINAI